MPQRIQNINGVLYVYEDRATWDKTTKNAKHIRHYIGKMINNVFVPNKKYLLERELDVNVGLIFPVLVGLNFPVSDHQSKPTAPTRSLSFIR